MRYFILLALIAFCSTNAMAQERQIPENVTVIHLQEEAVRKVTQDKIKAILNIESENTDSAELQNTINRAMQKAMQRSGRADSVETSTTGYQVYKVNKTKENRLSTDIWRGMQTLELDSLNKEAGLNLVSDLQEEGFVLKGLSYYLSKEKTRTYRDELMKEAISRIQARAKQVSAQLSLPSIHMADLNLSQSIHTPYPVRGMRMEMMSSAKTMAAPVVEGSDEEVKIGVQATVWLMP